MRIVVCLCVVFYAFLTSAYQIKRVPTSPETIYNDDVKHGHIIIVPPLSGRKPYDNNGQLGYPDEYKQNLYSNENYNYKLRNVINHDLNSLLPRVNYAHEKYLKPDKKIPTNQIHFHGIEPQAKPSYHDFGYYQNHKNSEQCPWCDFQHKNLQNIKYAGILDASPDLSSSEAEGNTLTQTITNEAAIGPDPGTSDYINSIIEQNAQQGIDARTIWKSILDAAFDPGSPEAEGNTLTQSITNKVAIEPYPGIYEYINSIIKPNAHRGINTRKDWRSIVDGGPDSDTDEAKNSPPIETITDEAATGPDPGTAEYMNSINKQNADKGIHTLKFWVQFQ